MQASPGIEREGQSPMTDRLGEMDRANIQENRSIDSHETEVGKVRRYALDGISADVFRIARTDGHIIAIGFDVIYFVDVERIESTLSLTDQNFGSSSQKAQNVPRQLTFRGLF
jgi:hypothetical protein